MFKNQKMGDTPLPLPSPIAKKRKGGEKHIAQLFIFLKITFKIILQLLR